MTVVDDSTRMFHDIMLPPFISNTNDEQVLVPSVSLEGGMEGVSNNNNNNNNHNSPLMSGLYPLPMIHHDRDDTMEDVNDDMIHVSQMSLRMFHPTPIAPNACDVKIVTEVSPMRFVSLHGDDEMFMEQLRPLLTTRTSRTTRTSFSRGTGDNESSLHSNYCPSPSLQDYVQQHNGHQELFSPRPLIAPIKGGTTNNIDDKGSEHHQFLTPEGSDDGWDEAEHVTITNRIRSPFSSSSLLPQRNTTVSPPASITNSTSSGMIIRDREDWKHLFQNINEIQGQEQTTNDDWEEETKSPPEEKKVNVISNTTTTSDTTTTTTTTGSGMQKQTQKWMCRYQELYEYKQKYGHCRVPYSFPEDQRLAQWVKRQRHQMKLLSDGKHSNLTPDRVELLTQLGFVWNAHQASWEEYFQLLCNYKTMTGHCTVTPNYQKENPSFAAWVKSQKRLLRKWGNRIFMPSSPLLKKQQYYNNSSSNWDNEEEKELTPELLERLRRLHYLGMTSNTTSSSRK